MTRKAAIKMLYDHPSDMEPLLPSDDTGLWTHHLATGDLSHTVLTWLGAGHGWIALLPCLVAAALAAAATPLPRLGRSDALGALVALACWLALAILAPIAVVPGHPVTLGAAPLLAIAAVLSAGAVLTAVRAP